MGVKGLLLRTIALSEDAIKAETEVIRRDVPVAGSAFSTRSSHSCSGHLILGVYNEERFFQFQVSCNVKRIRYRFSGVSSLANMGNCCWKVFSKIRFQGQSETVGLGHIGPVQLHEVKSIKKVQCV